MNVVERFLKYVSFDTESDPHSESYPTSLKQLELGKYLVEELKEIGVEDVHLNEHGIVYAKLPATGNVNAKKVGFVAHMDTSPDMCGANVKPRIVENYDGGTIVLNEELNISMNRDMFACLNRHIGKDLIVTDGTTLLGADDKAGVAEIMTMVETLVKENISHGEIRIAFTPDEEVGKGTDNFDVNYFDADFAYTVDGGEVESVDYENFNAAAAKIEIKGSSIHPGSAKNKMINASLLAMEFHSLLPVQKNPAYTEGYEGFNHLHEIKGSCEDAYLEYIIRNHSEQEFEIQKQEFEMITAYLNQKYGEDTFKLTLEDSYANMRTIIEKDMRIIDLVKESMLDLGVQPTSSPIRGGTDGARLTYEGLPTPNLGTGGYNYHGKYEYACIQEMETSVALLLKIVEKVNAE